MRFQATKENLVVQIGANETVALVQAAIRLIVPRYTKKVYFIADPASLHVPTQEGVVVISAGAEPSNFLQSFRLILSPGQLVVVSSNRPHFTQTQWRSFAEELEACTT